jgi:hypothetical protein
MTDNEYEILPHQLLQDLKYDVEALKKKLSQPDAKVNELILEIESLKDTIHELTNIFHKALDTAKDDGDVTKTVSILKEKMEAVVTQNETIAKGMIAISDKLEDWMGNSGGASVRPSGPPPQHSMGVPSEHGPSRMAPMPSMQPPSAPQMDFPPPPPGGKRKGLF